MNMEDNLFTFQAFCSISWKTSLVKFRMTLLNIVDLSQNVALAEKTDAESSTGVAELFIIKQECRLTC